MFVHPPIPLKALNASFSIQLLIPEVTPRQAHAHGQGQRVSFPQDTASTPRIHGHTSLTIPGRERDSGVLGLHTLSCNCLLGKQKQKLSAHAKRYPERIMNSSKVTQVAGLRLEHPYHGVPSRTYILNSWCYCHYMTKWLIVSLESWFLLLIYRHHLSTIF